MKRLAVVLLVLLASAPAHAQRRVGTEKICEELRHRETPVVDLYSFEVGAEVFEKFGHTMLCLTYPSYTPICFNYGVTDFSNPPKLFWGFLRSKQKFWVDGERLDSMLAFYGSADADDFEMIPEGVGFSPEEHCLVREGKDGRCGRPGDAEDRQIWRQRLPLTDEKARSLADRLCTDMEPENRYYIYHHFKDNCTTRLRDMIDTLFEGKLKEGSDQPYPLTFREFAYRGLAEYELLIGVSDFIGGRNLDHRPTEWEAMFHPDILRTMVDEKLGIEPELVYARKGPPFPTRGPTGRPWVVLISVLLTAPLVLVRWRGWRDRAAVAVASLPLILWGLVLWATFFVISIDWLRWNEALFLFVPTDLALPFLGPKRRKRYAQARLVMIALVSLLVAVGLFEQPLWVPALVAFLPLSLIAFEWKVNRPTSAVG